MPNDRTQLVLVLVLVLDLLSRDENESCRDPPATPGKITRQNSLGASWIQCYFILMDTNSFLPHRKRGMVFLIISLVMLVLGETVLRNSLSKVPFIVYWMVCFVFTGLAIIFAFLDVAGVQRQAREQQRELLEKTINEIARQKELKSGRSTSGQK